MAPVENPGPSIGHGVTICDGRSDGSSEASSFARSRAAMFESETREPSTEVMSSESPPAPCATVIVPTPSVWSFASVSSTDTIRGSAAPPASIACASGVSVTCGLSNSAVTAGGTDTGAASECTAPDERWCDGSTAVSFGLVRA